jgi:hypothetical protein
VVVSDLDGRVEGFGGIDGNFAGVALCVPREMGNSFVIEGDAFLRCPFGVIVGSYCCYSIKPWFLN